MHPFVNAFIKFFATLILLIGAFCNAAVAHELRPSIVDMEIEKSGALKLQIKLNLEAVIAGIGPEHEDTSQSKNAKEYDRLRGLSSSDLKIAFDGEIQKFLQAINLKADQQKVELKLVSTQTPKVGDIDLARTSVLNLSGALPIGVTKVTWSWAQVLGNSVVRVKGADGSSSNLAKDGEQKQEPVFAALVKAGETSKLIDVKNLVNVGKWDVFVQYIDLGFEHIVPKGLDHILFVIGLFLLSTRLSSLLWQVSSFTLAHTITLGLAMAGFISAPASIVEPLIALSIVYVAVENVFTSSLNKWRPIIVFLFGLLHGLGFASVLSELGLEQANFAVGLLGFNIGVEIGQLLVIAACFLLVGFWFGKKPYYKKYITNPASIIIALIAAWWFVERTFL